jgi:hypothetical protein
VINVVGEVNARGLSSFAAFGFPKRVGQGRSIVYLVAFRDGHSEPISGEHTHKLHVPANVAARQYRSLIAHNSLTNAFIRESAVAGRFRANESATSSLPGQVMTISGCVSV